MSVHDGHRERLRQRFLDEGLEHFTDIQVLELLLFYAIARRDTNVIAHRLLDRFGSLSRVLDASVEELCKVEGVGQNAAIYLHLIIQAGRCYQRDRAELNMDFTTLEGCAKYLVPFFFGQTKEVVYLLCLDSKCKLLCCKKIAEGGVNSTEISTRKILETVLSVKASSVLLAHNHPDGMAIPSAEDVSTTMNVIAALQAVDVQFVDHLVVCNDDFVSMMQSGYMGKRGLI